jgi:hypothetical protein
VHRTGISPRKDLPDPMSDQKTARPAPPGDAPGALRVIGLTAAGIGLAALAGAAFVLSYQGIHAFAQQAGISSRLARGYPLLFDVLLVVIMAAVLALRGAGLPSRMLGWTCLITLPAAATGADALHAAGRRLPVHAAAVTAAIVPWVLVLIAFSLLLAMLRHARHRRVTSPAGQAAAGRGPRWQPPVPPPLSISPLVPGFESSEPAAAATGSGQNDTLRLPVSSAAGPQSAGPQSAGPQSAGPQSAGPAQAVPTAADPASPEPALAEPVLSDSAVAEPAMAMLQPPAAGPPRVMPAAPRLVVPRQVTAESAADTAGLPQSSLAGSEPANCQLPGPELPDPALPDPALPDPALADPELPDPEAADAELAIDAQLLPDDPSSDETALDPEAELSGAGHANASAAEPGPVSAPAGPGRASDDAGPANDDTGHPIPEANDEAGAASDEAGQASPQTHPAGDTAEPGDGPADDVVAEPDDGPAHDAIDPEMPVFHRMWSAPTPPSAAGE